LIINLAEHENGRSVSTQVLVIGGGIAGLLLAVKLREHGVQVVVLESGGLEQKEGTHPLNRVVLLGDQYQGAAHGRFRCLGGTSSRWGGALIPLLPEDFIARPHLELPAWPVGIEVLERYLGGIEDLFGVTHGSYEENCTKDIGANGYVPAGDDVFNVRFAKWPQFKNRNVATLLRRRIGQDPGLAVWINATATDFELDERHRLHSVAARHLNGNVVRVTSDYVVLCAGAIESTRLLLLLDSQYQGKVFNRCRVLGHFFYDHISAVVATINPKEVRRLNRMAALRFTGQTMRSVRFELSPSVQASARVPSAFGHISFQATAPSGFNGLRDFLRSIQRDGRVDPSLGLRLLSDIPYLAKAALWRYVYKQLYWPDGSKYELHVAAEQRPRYSNFIALTSDTDMFGLFLAAIKWRIHTEDFEVFSTFIRLFDYFWKRRGLEEIGELEWLVDANTISADGIPCTGDVYHPGGSTRMGTDGHSAVVDFNLRTFAIPNLWVASTSVFPSGASANPTLMLMLFTMRLAEHLVKLHN
jgi:choline dehydrogenase-like flavoprotein